MVNGEVLVPQAIVWDSSQSVNDYVEKAGGFSDRANETQIVVVHANGATEVGTHTNVKPGDEIMILPEVKFNSLQIAGQVMDIIYKAAVAAAVAPRAFGVGEQTADAAAPPGNRRHRQRI